MFCHLQCWMGDQTNLKNIFKTIKSKLISYFIIFYNKFPPFLFSIVICSLNESLPFPNDLFNEPFSHLL